MVSFKLFDPMMKKKKKKKVPLDLDFESVPSSQPEPDTNKENEKAEAIEELQSKKKETGTFIILSSSRLSLSKMIGCVNHHMSLIFLCTIFYVHIALRNFSIL